MIRMFTETDREQVIALWRACGLVSPHNNPDRDIDRKMAHSPEFFFVAENAGRVVGTCMAGYEGHRGWIFYLGVDPEHRGRGVARAMVERAEQALALAGCPKIDLMVRDSNHQALGFYRAVGYDRDPVCVLSKRLAHDDPHDY